MKGSDNVKKGDPADSLYLPWGGVKELGGTAQARIVTPVSDNRPILSFLVG